MKMLKKGASHLSPGDVVLAWYVPTAPSNVVQEMAFSLTVAEVKEQHDLNDRLVGHYVGWQLGDTVEWSDLHPLTDRALYVPAEFIPEETAGTYACAECGTTTATTYVVTTLDPENERETRTEVCEPCHVVITAPEGMPALVYGEQATDSFLDHIASMERWAVTVTTTEGETFKGAFSGAGYGDDSMAVIHVVNETTGRTFSTEDVRQVLIH